MRTPGTDHQARTEVRTGADGLRAVLEHLGINIVFGLPGVHNLAIWSALAGSPIRVFGVRHEQTAAYGADALARTTGQLGVAITTTGPGAANAVAATGEAFASRSPIVVIATDISTTLRHPDAYRGALHETRDQAAMFKPVTLATLRASTAAEVAEMVIAAAEIAIGPPSGPVYVEIPTDLLAEPCGWNGRTDQPMLRPRVQTRPTKEEVAKAAAMILRAKRPLLWVGGGAARASEARAPIQRLAEQLAAPVIETFMGRGLMDPGHPAAVGLPPHVPEVGHLWDNSDLIVAIGSDLDGPNTQNWSMPAPPALIAINVDPEDARKNYEPDLVLAGDAGEVTRDLTLLLPSQNNMAELRSGLTTLRGNAIRRLSAEEPRAFDLVETLTRSWPGRCPIVCDMCIPGYWIAGFMPFIQPRRLVYPVGWGTLGFGLPAAIGAACGDGGNRVLCVSGDGGFMFACGELAAARQENTPITILLVDDGGYGMLAFDFIAAGEKPVGVDLVSPDWSRLASAFDIPCDYAGDFGPSLSRLLERHATLEGPTMIVARARLLPPPTTSPRWYRNADETLTQEEVHS